MNYIDFILIGILVIYLLIGFFKGFGFSILSLFSFSVKFIISLLLCKPATTLMNGVFKLNIALENGINSGLLNKSEAFGTNMDGLFQSQLDSHVSNCVDSMKMPDFLGSYFKKIFHLTEGNTNFSFGDLVSKTFGQFFSYVITFVIIFILIALFVLILKLVLKKKIENNAGVKNFDKTLGIVYGAIRGALNIVVLFIVLSFFKNLSFMSWLYSAINNSVIGGWLSNLIFPTVDKYVNLKEIFKWVLNQL